MLSINPPIGKWTWAVDELTLDLTWEAPMLTTGLVPLAKLPIETDLGNFIPTARTWLDTTHYRMIYDIFGAGPTWLNFSFLGPDPGMRTAAGTQVEPFTLTNVPDPPWLVNNVGQWVAAHAPPPPPHTPERDAWFAELRAMIHQWIIAHEAEE